jgi:putative flavoprotein involved in K+ transport
VTPEKGIYILGMRFEMTRSSSFIDGVGADANVIANHISMHSLEEK